MGLLSYPESYPSQSRAVVGQLGICWARTSRLVTLGTAFINFLTVVARSGVPSAITRSQNNDTSAVIDALRVAMTDGQLAQTLTQLQSAIELRTPSDPRATASAGN